MVEAYFNQLPAKEKIIVTRATFFMESNFLASLAIQFDIEQDDTIDNIVFKDTTFYFSNKIMNLSWEQLKQLIKNEMIKYVFNYQYVLENPSVVADINEFKMFLLSIMNSTRKLTMLDNEIIETFDKDFFQYYSSKYKYKYGDYFRRHVKEYELPQILTFARNEHINFALTIHVITGRFDELDSFLERYYEVKHDFESATDIIPATPFVGKQCNKCMTLMKMMNAIVKHKDNNSYQFDRLYWLLTLPLDLLVFSITYAIHDANLKQKLMDNVEGFNSRWYNTMRYITRYNDENFDSNVIE